MYKWLRNACKSTMQPMCRHAIGRVRRFGAFVVSKVMPLASGDNGSRPSTFMFAPIGAFESGRVVSAWAHITFILRRVCLAQIADSIIAFVKIAVVKLFCRVTAFRHFPQHAMVLIFDAVDHDRSIAAALFNAPSKIAGVAGGPACVVITGAPHQFAASRPANQQFAQSRQGRERLVQAGFFGNKWFSHFDLRWSFWSGPGLSAANALPARLSYHGGLPW